MANIGLWTPDRTEFVERFRYKVTDVKPTNKRDFIVLTNNTHLVIYREGISTFSGKLLKDQFELPLVALDWVFLTMTRLALPKDKGGYPDGRFADDLYLSKDIDIVMSYGLNHVTGYFCYHLINKAARGYIAGSTQDIELYLATLHEGGLLAKLVEINDLYKDGKL